MTIRAVLKSLFAAENPAITAHELVLKRLDALEEAVNVLAEDQDDVISKVRSWSAREAAKKRHETARNLNEMMAGAGEGGDDSDDPGASSGQGDPGDLAMRRMADQRAAAKAAIARQFRRG